MADDASGDERPGSDGTRPEADEPASGPNGTDADEEWGRIPIDLSGDREDGPAVGDGPDPGPDDGTYAPEPGSAPIEPGTPSLENAAFVLLGALLMLVVVFRLFTIMLG